jgi:hypothetical protein
MPAFYQVYPIWNAMRTELSRTHDRPRFDIPVDFKRQPFEWAIKMLDVYDVFNHTVANNTLHASRRICAPWRVTFFLRRKNAAKAYREQNQRPVKIKRHDTASRRAVLDFAGMWKGSV